MLYERQIQFLVDKDVDGLIETNYAPDAELITFQTVIKGRDALRTYFRGYIEMLGDIVVESTDKFAETDDAILFEATVRSKPRAGPRLRRLDAARRTDHPSLHRRHGHMTVSDRGDDVPMATDLTEAEVKTLVDAWYHALDVHVPVEEIAPMVTADVECQWPEGPTYGVDEFKGWYHKVTHLFFDEVHTMK